MFNLLDWFVWVNFGLHVIQLAPLRTLRITYCVFDIGKTIGDEINVGGLTKK